MGRQRGIRLALGVLLMASYTFYPRFLVAQELDVRALVGEDWYGLYFNGAKAGYMRNALDVLEDGSVTAVEEGEFRVSMYGRPQEMTVYSKRVYAASGELQTIVYRVVDPAGLKEFNAFVDGDALVLRSTVAGLTKEERLPRPKESLQDALKEAELVGEGAKAGDSITFSLFDPMFQREITGTSTIQGVEERLFDGAPTKVFRVKTHVDMMGIESEAFLAADGTTLEDIVAGMMTMRLEPEAMAKDVDYSNDVIISNAAMLDAPLANPRTRDALTLRVRGPLTEHHLFNDNRQQFTPEDGHWLFASKRIAPPEGAPVRIPVTDPALAKWLAPTSLVQCQDPAIAAKAKEIIGGETDALKVSELLCRWVAKNVESTFSAELTNAREVLNRLEGDCTEHSILFIGLARAAGLPAREVAGLIYMQEKDSDKAGFYFHQWAKVWAGAWIDVDPTFDQPLADVTHIKLAEGDLFDQMKLLPIIGRLDVEVVGE